MHIYVDESGTFVPANHSDAWCVVVAYVLPESKVRHLKNVLTKLKLSAGKTFRDEVKLREISEQNYFLFLKDLRQLQGSLYCTATNMSLVTQELIRDHQSKQALKILEHIDKMLHEAGKQGLRNLSDKINSISPQLYTQLMCQLYLFKDVIDRAILYYVQRHPKSLRQFRWRIDQKNTTKIEYEIAFERIAPTILQTMSMREPSIAVEEFDYSAMREFVYGKNEGPTYLNDVFNLDVKIDESLNIGKILNKDLQFADSKKELGIQVADLLASGIRRVLRGEFDNQDECAGRLGQLMIQRSERQHPLNLITLGSGSVDNKKTEFVLRNFRKFATPMVLELQGTVRKKDIY